MTPNRLWVPSGINKGYRGRFIQAQTFKFLAPLSTGCSSSGVSSTLAFFHDIFASPQAHRQETSCPWIEATCNKTKARLLPLSYFCWVACPSNKRSHTRISQECKAGTLTEEGELAVGKGNTVHRLSRARQVHRTLA